jgi:hypothetical protein
MKMYESSGRLLKQADGSQLKSRQAFGAAAVPKETAIICTVPASCLADPLVPVATMSSAPIGQLLVDGTRSFACLSSDAYNFLSFLVPFFAPA